MYARPAISPVSLATETATCCHITVGGFAQVTNPGCGDNPFPTCNNPFIVTSLCTVSIGPVTISGNP